MVYNSDKSIKAQAEYIRGKGVPHFAPRCGQCYRCFRNIYEQSSWAEDEYGNWKEVVSDSPKAVRVTGISVEKAGKELITGCPHCNYSFCD